MGDDKELGARLKTIGIEPLQLVERKRSIASVGGGKVVLISIASVAAIVIGGVERDIVIPKICVANVVSLVFGYACIFLDFFSDVVASFFLSSLFSAMCQSFKIKTTTKEIQCLHVECKFNEVYLLIL